MSTTSSGPVLGNQTPIDCGTIGCRECQTVKVSIPNTVVVAGLNGGRLPRMVWISLASITFQDRVRSSRMLRVANIPGDWMAINQTAVTQLGEARTLPVWD